MGFVVKVTNFSLENFWFSAASHHFLTVPVIALQVCDRLNQPAHPTSVFRRGSMSHLVLDWTQSTEN
jgi:hypothetical protein